MEAIKVKGVYCPTCGSFEGEISNISHKSMITLYCYGCREEFNFKLENKNTKWKFWDLFHETTKKLKNRDSNMAIERTLIRFLERLPIVDISKIREEWNNQKQ